jgi:hypothetical protein
MPVPVEIIQNKIYLIRGLKVMFDKDLAEMYGVPTKVFNQQVKRNIKRFPSDFMFQLNHKEFDNLKSQIVTSSWGGTRKLPYVFTEQGVAMLSSQIFEALRRLMTTPSTSQDSLPNPYKRTKAGFIVDKESARKGHHAH